MSSNLKNSTWRVVLWSLLDSGNNAPFLFMMYFFLVFNNASYGISAVVVGIMMGLSRVFDGFTDPIIGLMIDKINTKWGKYRPSLLIGAILLNTSIIGIFWGLSFDSVLWKIVFLSILYIIHIIGYTFVTATWKAGNTIVTKDPKQRSMQSMYMGIGTMIIAIGIMAGTIPFLNQFGGVGSALGWRYMGVIIAAINIFFVLLAMIAISNRDNDQYYIVPEKHHTLKEFLPVLKENKPLAMLIVAASTNKLAATTMSTVTVFWYAVILRNIELQSTMSMVTMPFMIISMFAATILAVKTSKKFTMQVGSWLSIIALILLVLIRPFAPDQLIIYIILFGLVTTFNNIANAQVNVMIADTADYELWKTGKSIPGMISTTFSFIDKLVSSASGFLVGGVIGLFGYSLGASDQMISSGLYWSIMALFVGVPILGHIASLWALKRYTLDREMNAKIAMDLKTIKKVV